MNDDDGFTIVDAMFGVREVSDSSDTEGGSSPGPTKRSTATLAEVAVAATAGENNPDNIIVSPAELETTAAAQPASAGRRNMCGIELAVSSGTFGGEVFQEEWSKLPIPLGPDFEKTGAYCAPKLNISQTQAAAATAAEAGRNSQLAVPDTATTCAPAAVGWGIFRKKSPAAAELSFAAQSKKKIQLTKDDQTIFYSNSNHNNNNNDSNNDNDNNDGTSSPTLDSSKRPDLDNMPRVVPTSPDALIQEAIVSSGTSQNEPGKTRSTKTVTVRLLPGDLEFDAVIPKGGNGGYVTSVADLERELQRELGLWRPVRLTGVQVVDADAQEFSLSDAPDRSTVTARPIDRVLVRARVCRAPAPAAAVVSPIDTALKPLPASPSAWDKLVQLPLGNSWLEATEVIKIKLGIPADRRVEVRRLVRQVSAAAAETTKVGRVPPPEDEAPPASVRNLFNGDTLVVNISEEEDFLVKETLGDNNHNRVADNRQILDGMKSRREMLVAPQPPPLSALPTGLRMATVSLRTRKVKNNVESHWKADGKLFETAVTRLHPLPGGDQDSGNGTSSRASSSLVSNAREETEGHPSVTNQAPLSPASMPLPPPRYAEEDSGQYNKASLARSSGTVPAAKKICGDRPVKFSIAKEEAAFTELVGMGFARDNVVEALRKCVQGDSSIEEALSLLLEPQISTDVEAGLKGDKGAESQRRGDSATSSPCPICISDIPAGEVFTVDCKHQHIFCVGCLYQHCTVQLLDSGLIPACPLSNMTCGHELSQQEVERVFLLKTYSSIHEGNDAAADGAGRAGGVLQSEQDSRALETCRTLLTRRGLESSGAIPCVSAECGNWMVPEGSGQRVRCSSCLTEFCASCKRSPYHYVAKCEDVVRLGREWSLWLTEGKSVFLQAVAVQGDEHKALLLQHQRRKQEHDRAMHEAEQLRQEYDKMEDWKERRCRCCPSCGRLIEKTSGCDMMVCGSDAHGGNIQNGCGKRFDWNMALAYTADRGVRKLTPFTEQKPLAAARSRHYITEGIPLRCDRCHRDVVGPLFRCVHCPSFACCLGCQDMACRDPRHVHHTFQVVDRGENTPAPPAARSRDGGGVLSGRRGERGPLSTVFEDPV